MVALLGTPLSWRETAGKMTPCPVLVLRILRQKRELNGSVLLVQRLTGFDCGSIPLRDISISKL